jgi:hypothetical protein
MLMWFLGLCRAYLERGFLLECYAMLRPPTEKAEEEKEKENEKASVRGKARRKEPKQEQ